MVSVVDRITKGVKDALEERGALQERGRSALRNAGGLAEAIARKAGFGETEGAEAETGGAKSISEGRSTAEAPCVEVDYINHRGERRWRKIRPVAIGPTTSEWHPGGLQWILWAIDMEDGKQKDFAMTGIKGWRNV